MCRRGAIHFPPIYPESRRRTHDVEAREVTIDFFPIASVKPRVKGYTIHNPARHGQKRAGDGVS